MPERFQVRLLEEAVQFLDSLDEKARDKVIYNITKAKFSNNKELFKKLKGEIWAFRTLYNKIHYRLFAFWDKTGNTKTVVISTHGLIKKTEKTPFGDIEKAEKIRKRYFELRIERNEK
jgi:phage-related protein